MLYASETRCFGEKETASLKRTERAMYGMKLFDRRNSEELMDVLGTVEFMNGMAKVSSMGLVWRKKMNM